MGLGGIGLIYNGSVLKNPEISGAIFTLNLSILILNSQCVKGARDFRVLEYTPVIFDISVTAFMY